MDNSGDRAARHEAVLKRVQQLSLALAEDLADAVVATRDEDKKARLAGAYHKITRGLRQAVALEARLARYEAAGERAEADRAKAAAREGAERRSAQVKARVERLVWNEYDEGDDDEFAEGGELIERAEEWLSEAAEAEGFAETSVGVHLARLCAHLGLDWPAAQDSCGDPAAAARPNSS
ncbi:hypothetical protein [Phenylobacterium sp.]|uniref:hypothetical protein n=1 Tax=Phenylobacterium sp. TaxID=1871053 RepID=UPI00262D3022|nr:hypothetical protein [Phenylobacterium sp.]